MLHRQKQLQGAQKELRKRQEELQSLMNQVSRDPLLTIQLRSSTIEKLRETTKKYWAPEMKETLE